MDTAYREAHWRDFAKTFQHLALALALALGTYWAKTKDLANRGGHFVRRSENIHGYVTSAAVDNQANKPPKLFVMTEK